MLGELVDRPVEFALDEELRGQIREGSRGRRLSAPRSRAVVMTRDGAVCVVARWLSP
ncbi:MAG: hypothetical protein HYV93_11875 [Candidatus Rokubacteria bacterium]|nr:hypothetical protein [Candidatus Rokubacteria bacterium]